MLDTEDLSVEEPIVETVVDGAPPAPPAPPPDTLAPAKFEGCQPATCELEYRPWSGRDHWFCEACQHSTFHAGEAAARRPSLNK